MDIGADFALYGRYGHLVALVEVKAKRGTSPEWAAQLRSNMLEHGRFRDVPFFLLVTPDRLYLWKDAGSEPVAVPPTYVVDGQPVFKRYFENTRVRPEGISGFAFEIIVTGWLSDLVHGEAEPAAKDWLQGSGLLNAVRDAAWTTWTPLKRLRRVQLRPGAGAASGASSRASCHSVNPAKPGSSFLRTPSSSPMRP